MQYLKQITSVRISLWILAVFLQILVGFSVYARAVNLFTLVAWLGSIVLAAHLLGIRRFSIDKKMIPVLAILVIAQIAVLTFFGNIQTHYHQDEFITAYTSWSLPTVEKLDWFSAYPPVWVSQFPVLFHVLQKPFFFLFGPSTWAIRISVWPYAVGILVYLYYFVYLQFTKKAALLACIVYIFFAPHLYLSSRGLHFISSTFFYIAAITHFVAYTKTNNKTHAILAGLFSGLSYLTYTSSYVTYPVLATLAISTNRKALPIITIMTFLVLLPFLVYAGTVNNFFTQRVSQVNAIWGSWSDPAREGVGPLSIITNQTINAVASFVKPGIGGLGGYNFGKLGLLDPLSAILLALGFLMLLKNRIFVIALLIPLITGFILTTHPPPFHRLSIVYPFLAVPIGIILSKSKLYLIVPIVIIANLVHANHMIENDIKIYPQNSRLIGEFISKNIPQGEKIQIAAYPSFYLGQELLFRTHNAYPIITTTTEEMLSSYERSTLILLNPTKETLDKVHGEIIESIEGTDLGDLTLVK